MEFREDREGEERAAEEGQTSGGPSGMMPPADSGQAGARTDLGTFGVLTNEDGTERVPFWWLQPDPDRPDYTIRLPGAFFGRDDARRAFQAAGYTAPEPVRPADFAPAPGVQAEADRIAGDWMALHHQQADQERQRMVTFAGILGAYYTSLIAAGVPEGMVNHLVQNWHGMHLQVWAQGMLNAAAAQQ